ncbi:MAG TPA: FecR domain-containing protein [Polyangiaceae bacterium]|nr:FecR domain-containing protein [Polyangiaceae bacterium]
MTASERSEPRLAHLSEVWRASVKPPHPAELERGLAGLRLRLSAGAARPRFVRRMLPLAAAVVVALTLAPLLVSRFFPGSRTPAPVEVAHVAGGKILEAGYLAEVGGKGMELSFNEGSRFSLTPGTRGRLRTVSAEGVRLALDRGAASLRITPNHERHWWVEAGPFVVSVTGTDFTVKWDPASEELAVKLRQGRVAVSGPIVGDELVLRPGQNLTVNLTKRETVISEEGADQPSVAAPAEPAASAPAAPATGAATPAAASAAGAPSAASGVRRWREALASGQWDRILADVERDGVEASLRTLSSDELFALADAARYRRRTDLARSALLAQRERFPNSSRAPDAVFLLGRVEELRAEGKPRALQRYDEYLARAPNGTYAAEALGRRMILVKELEGPESARRIAVEYLRRFPQGSYAEAAHTLERAH